MFLSNKVFFIQFQIAAIKKKKNLGALQHPVMSFAHCPAILE
jgi:hypothetical protein